MLQELTIQNFRLFQELHIDSLSRINLFVGRNNSGKTALLEALLLLFDQGQRFAKFPSLFRSAQGHSIDDFENFWTWLYYDRNLDTAAQIRGSSADMGQAYLVGLESATDTVRINYYEHRSDSDSQRAIITRTIHRSSGLKPQNIAPQQSDWPAVSVFSTRPHAPEEDIKSFNQVAIKRGGRQRLIELLKEVEPRLQDLQYLQLGTKPFIYADVGLETLIPVSQLGQGFGRLLQIYSEVILSESKIILIDEIENGLSYRAQLDLWRGLAQSLDDTDIQIFATTHSYECVQAAYEVYGESQPLDFNLHRLERRDDNQIHVVSYSPATLKTALEFNFEVRG